MQMEALKINALSYIAQHFAAVANLSHDLAGLAESLLTRLAKVRFVLFCVACLTQLSQFLPQHQLASHLQDFSPVSTACLHAPLSSQACMLITATGIFAAKAHRKASEQFPLFANVHM